MLTIDDVIERFDGSLAYSTNSKEICQYIADLLKELKERRKEPEVIRCNECAFCRPFLSDKVCSLGLLHNINLNMDFCSRAVRKQERRTDGA